MTRHVLPPRDDEIEGYLTGVEHRLNAAGDSAPPELRAWLGEAKVALRLREFAVAEARLRAIDAALDRAKPEEALREWPRGLRSFQGPGSDGPPPEPDEEPVANRLLLVQRLIAVRRSQGWATAGFEARLREADRLYRAGDRVRAKAMCDEVHAALDRPRPPSE